MRLPSLSQPHTTNNNNHPIPTAKQPPHISPTHLYGTARSIRTGGAAIAVTERPGPGAPLLEHGHNLLPVVGHIVQPVIGVQEAAVGGLQRVHSHPGVVRLPGEMYELDGSGEEKTDAICVCKSEMITAQAGGRVWRVKASSLMNTMSVKEEQEDKRV